MTEPEWSLGREPLPSQITTPAGKPAPAIIIAIIIIIMMIMIMIMIVMIMIVSMIIYAGSTGGRA